MIKDFFDFIDEGYLDSNHAPLYHFTDNWYLRRIVRTNSLQVGFFEHDINSDSDKKNIVSLTREKNFKILHKNFTVKICLDKNKLVNGYKISPYDFFIKNGTEIYSKWNTKRIKPFESEEIVYYDIDNLNRYILYIDFFDISYLYECLDDIRDYIDKNNVEIRVSEKIINLNDL
jgi:hypothetical protein